VKEGDFLAIMGPSGSGKSTLMNIIGCLDKASAGSYHIEGTDVSDLSDNQLSDLRNQKIGFVFQNFNLMPKLTACQNVELPLTYMKVPKKERRERALEMLRLVGLEERSDFKPMELSGGQKQRVAIARALVTNPSFILGDEPTGALDTKTSVQIMELFKQFNEQGKTIVIITHEPEVAQLCKQTVVLRDGNIETRALG
jgi:ATP-binding cassette protein